MPASTNRTRTLSWYLLNAFAVLGTALVALAFGSLIYVSVTDRMPKLELPQGVWALGSLSMAALLLLWICMLVDFFRERPSTNRLAWGWFLFLGTYLGGLAYFWAVWRPRYKLK